MSRYLNPRVDFVFKKIFGDHPDLLKSFLNSVLPLPHGHKIQFIEYLPSEQIPRIPAFKRTIVDVRCKDENGRIFIVEMQIQWTNAFMQRMLFNTTTAYVKQLETGENYSLLKPVYGLALLDEKFSEDDSMWYHHYKLINVEKPKAEIKDLQLIFIELPKFISSTLQEKKLQVLWLRFMSELGRDQIMQIPPEWLAVPEIKKAVTLAEEAGFSKGELHAYERYWDAVSTEKTLMSGLMDEAMEKGMEKAKIEVAKNLLSKAIDIGVIAETTGITTEFLQQLQQKFLAT